MVMLERIVYWKLLPNMYKSHCEELTFAAGTEANSGMAVVTFIMNLQAAENKGHIMTAKK